MDANTFFIRSDGTFQAHLGDVLLKAEKVGETEGYHFVGVASTADRDRDGEVLLQKGLNFEPFKEYGEFNWNHVPHAMVGIPVGRKAWAEPDGWRCEGMILKGLPVTDGYTTDMIVQQHNALKKSGSDRGLCCSVEGKVTQRSPCGKYVEKADIVNVALTFRPVNPACSVSVLAKSMNGRAQIVTNDDFYKSLSPSMAAPMVREDLEGAGVNQLNFEDRLVKHLIAKGYSKEAAQKHVLNFFRKKFSGRGSEK